MARFLITYLGGDQPASPEKGKANMAKYMEWLKGLGKAAVSPANPIKDAQTVHPDGSVTRGSQTAMSGYTVVEAESIKRALEMAKRCPFLEVNGTLEVSLMVEM